MSFVSLLSLSLSLLALQRDTRIESLSIEEIDFSHEDALPEIEAVYIYCTSLYTSHFLFLPLSSSKVDELIYRLMHAYRTFYVSTILWTGESRSSKFEGCPIRILDWLWLYERCIG